MDPDGSLEDEADFVAGVARVVEGLGRCAVGWTAFVGGIEESETAQDAVDDVVLGEVGDKSAMAAARTL